MRWKNADRGESSCCKRTHNEIKMKEGRDYWMADLYEKSFSDFVTVIMDSEDPLFILYILPDLQENLKECCTPVRLYSFTPTPFKTSSIIKKMIFTGVQQISDGSQDTLYSLRAAVERCYYSDL